MLLLVSLVCGLFKWRQFEPEVIRTPCRRGLLVDHVYRLEVDAALRPGNGTTFAPATQTDRRQLAAGRNLHPDQGQVALICIVRRILPARPSTFSSRPNAMQRRQSASWPKAL
jgi:hypothetical protein